MVRRIVLALIAIVVVVAGFYGYKICQSLQGPEMGEVQVELQGLDSSKAWQQLLGTLEQAAQQILHEGDNGAISRQDAVERYNGLITIMSNTLRMPLNKDPARPLIVPSDLLPSLSKIGGNSPDADYHSFPVSQEYSYRLRGTRGKAPFFSIQAQSVKLDLINMQPRMYLTGAIPDSDLAYDEQGFFEVLISREKPAEYQGLWLPLDEKSFTVVVREYHHDRQREGEPELAVEVLDPVPAARPLTDKEVAARIQQVNFMSRFWFNARQWYPELWEEANINCFQVDEQGDDERSEELALAADVQYMLGAWKLAEDEALIIEGKAPDSVYWIIQIMDRWLETADFRRRRVHLNDSQVKLDDAGNYRIVISARDSGASNWLDTGGRGEGHMAFRWAHVDDTVSPTCRVVKITDL